MGGGRTNSARSSGGPGMDQQLSGIDASFLYLETPETPMHVAGLTFFELPSGEAAGFYRHFRQFFESRLHTIPIFSKRLAPSLLDLDHPGWVDESNLDLDYHLRETSLPPPGTMAQLEEVIARLHANPLDRSRPLWEAAPQIVSSMTSAFLGKPGEAPKGLAALQSLISQLPKLNAPKTPFNTTITRERSYAARAVSLGDAKVIAKAAGAKLNDVVMAICSGALRRYLAEKGQLPDKPLIAGVPISLREPGDTRQNNQVSGMLCSIATDVADPAERLKAILKSSSESKQIAGTFRDAIPQDFAFVGAPILLQLIMLVYGRSGLADKLPMPMNV